MEPEHHIPLGPFCLDVTHGCLWREEQVMGLRPRSLAVLRRSGRTSRPAGDESGAVTGLGGDAPHRATLAAEPGCRTGRNLFPADPRRRPAGHGDRVAGSALKSDALGLCQATVMKISVYVAASRSGQQKLLVGLIVGLIGWRLRENSSDSFWCINSGQPGNLIKITIKTGNDFNAQQSATKGNQRIMEIEVA